MSSMGFMSDLGAGSMESRSSLVAAGEQTLALNADQSFRFSFRARVPFACPVETV
jgi:hypothetical protein